MMTQQGQRHGYSWMAGLADGIRRHLFGACLLVAAAPIAAALQPVDLRCEGLADPLAAPAAPRLSWRVESADRAQTQAAFQILAAASAEALADDRGDLWDSGRVAMPRSPQISYQGRALSAGQVCHWKVRCWNAAGEASPWSQPARWEVGLLEPADWAGARWIDDGKANPERDEDFYQPDPAPLLRHEFTLAKPVTRARLHVAGLGYCYPSLNGARLDDHALDPPWTQFDKRILYRTHDVTGRIGEGRNCLGLTLGNGWFNPLPLRMWGGRNIRNALPVGRPRGIALLVVDHPDGTRTTVATGPGWQTATGPTLRNSIFLGEERDARLALPGWDRARFDATAWRPARATDAPLEPLRPLLQMPPVRAMKPLAAVAVTTPAPGTHIVDFGTNFTGLPEIDFRVPAGTRVLLRFGELLNADGTLNPLTSVCGQIKGMRKGKDGAETPIGGPGAPPIAWQQDVFIAAGGGKETYRPDFTFHAFRFMEITGLPAAPALADCRGIPRTFLSNVISVQSDCPHRERFGYGGDIVATSETFLMNFDMAGFYAKAVRDWEDASLTDGRFTDTAPFVGIDYCGVGWAMVHPLLLEQLHQHYGNRQLVAEQLPAALRWLEVEAARRKDGLVTIGLGDHEALAKARGPEITTPMFIDAARRVARLARLMGRDADAARCERLADESAAAWQKAFLDSASGKVAEGSQSAQVMALSFGAVPDAVRPAAFAKLVADLTAP
ncbi:MAG: family 78 glycoside hydrolase catalytic domain, partial [Akkermansiaceae bacterium]|nr:family 78 glycoside hydrolase catalytic domain [Akkermansiaceae bacterium]